MKLLQYPKWYFKFTFKKQKQTWVWVWQQLAIQIALPYNLKELKEFKD